jgi:hypothetical protein
MAALGSSPPVWPGCAVAGCVSSAAGFVYRIFPLHRVPRSREHPYFNPDGSDSRSACPLRDSDAVSAHVNSGSRVLAFGEMKKDGPFEEPAMEINGIAHVSLTAGDLKRSVAFYRELLPFLGLTPIADTDDVFYGVGGRTGIALRRRTAPLDDIRFDQTGLACIICVFGRAAARTWTTLICFCKVWMRGLSASRARTISCPATIRCCSKTRMASGSSSIMFQDMVFSKTNRPVSEGAAHPGSLAG